MEAVKRASVAVRVSGQLRQCAALDGLARWPKLSLVEVRPRPRTVSISARRRAHALFRPHLMELRELGRCLDRFPSPPRAERLVFLRWCRGDVGQVESQDQRRGSSRLAFRTRPKNRLGVPPIRESELMNDPSAATTKRMKLRYAGVCRGCGVEIPAGRHRGIRQGRQERDLRGLHRRRTRGARARERGRPGGSGTRDGRRTRSRRRC